MFSPRTLLFGSSVVIRSHCRHQQYGLQLLPKSRRKGKRDWLSTTSSPNNASSLKKLIKPFVLKCHPDMAQQQGLPKTAQKVNLVAIQNLNSYIDGVSTMEKGDGPYPFASASQSGGYIEIEFVMSFQTNSTGNAAHPTTSRRRVELQVPKPDYSIPRISHHVHKQIVKLLRMADLPIPANVSEEGDNAGVDTRNHEEVDEISDEWLAGQVMRHGSGRSRNRGKTPWEISRERFHRKINWKKLDQLYEDALADAQAHVLTKGMIRDNPRLRRELLAQILSNIKFTNDVQPLERLVAYRRLLRLLDDHFDYLHLEEFGRYWEEMKLVITSARAYNISASAMRKRRTKQLETGYSFTIHLDNTVTVEIPVDFRDTELIEELHRNVGDFYAWTQQGLGLESLFDNPY